MKKPALQTATAVRDDAVTHGEVLVEQMSTTVIDEITAKAAPT